MANGHASEAIALKTTHYLCHNFYISAGNDVRKIL